MLNIISLGAGVQSSTMALMAAHGEITPMPDCAIFADTGAEPKAVYEWLTWLETQLPFTVHRVARANLREEQLRYRASADGTGQYVDNIIPAFAVQNNQKLMLNRRCTKDFKISPLQNCIRKLLKEYQQESATVWIGISLDEAHRMKPSKPKYITNRWPLVDIGITRFHCLQWMKEHGYPEPAKSACSFCPYHSDTQWRDLKRDDYEAFQSAVKFEQEWNAAIKKDNRPRQIKGVIYLHRSCVPLDKVDFRSAEDAGQLSMFGNECEGMCGV
jgi:hypothetical protein